MTTEREGHGWWPYLGPYLAFLLAAQLGGEFPDSWQPALLVIKPMLPGGLILYFFLRGDYPELRAMKLQPGWNLLDILLGVVLAVQWMGPYLLIDMLPRPEPEDGFNPHMAGESMMLTILAIRMLGYAVVTPIFEELFIRSFVMRYADCYMRPGDFRTIEIARYTLRSFVTTVVVFTVAHAFWEWWVAVPWVVATNLWFYLRKDMAAPILVHASTNASILIYVTVATSGVPGHALWVFV
ncbi:MAG: CAAX prenyl protease-like protein [Myxococcota bacterium]|jgi:CAAX prenyl protease-like protein